MSGSSFKEKYIVFLFLIAVLAFLDIDLAVNYFYYKNADRSSEKSTGSSGIETPAASSTPVLAAPQPSSSSIEIVSFYSKSVRIEITDSNKKIVSQFTLPAVQNASKRVSLPMGAYTVKIEKEGADSFIKTINLKDSVGEAISVK